MNGEQSDETADEKTRETASKPSKKILDLIEAKGLSEKPELAAKQKRLLDILRQQAAESSPQDESDS